MRQLKAWESTMQKIDENYVLIGLIWLVGGMGYGIYMGITEQFNLANSHAHANLVGFVASVAFGLIYRAFPAMKSSRLATAQFWIYEIGAVVLVLGKAIVDNGGSNTVVKIGSLIVILGAVLMLVVFAKDRQGA
jgi:hypothetical protein